MRVLVTNHTATVSGAELSLLTMLPVLARRHEVLLAAPEGDLLERAGGAGVRTLVARGTDASWRLHPLRTPAAVASMVRAGVQLRSIARREQIDVVHANSLRAALIASCARILGGPPFVAHVHDKVGESRAARLVKAIVAGRAERVAVVSSFAAQDWASVRAARGKVATVHNPIDGDVFFPDEAGGRAWRAAAGIGDGEPLLAVVGQITPWKRQAHALKVFEALLRQLPDAHLLIVGEVKFAAPSTAFDNHAYERQLEERIDALASGRRVQMLGDRSDVASILRAADVLLAPALDEPFGRAVAEAIACGTPAVVSVTGGPVEFLRDGIDGVVVSGDSVEAWAAGCRQALKMSGDPELVRQRHEHVRLRLSTAAHALAIEDLLRAACARRGGRRS